MKIKRQILDKVNKPHPRTMIAVLLKCGEQTVAFHMRENTSNGRLTKMDALKAISEVAGVPVDGILEMEKATK